MTLSNVATILKDVSNESSRTAKEKILEENKNDTVLKKVLYYAYNPFFRYFMTSDKLPQFEGVIEDTSTVDEWFILLDLLRKRELTGNSARDMFHTILQRTQDVSVREMFVNIIDKDLRCGISSSTINKVFGKGFIPSFDTMLAHKFDIKRLEGHELCNLQLKYDGLRCIVRIDSDGSAVALSRNGLEITSIPHIVKEIEEAFKLLKVVDQSLFPIFLDGEILTGDFNKSVSELRKKNVVAKDAKFYVFDMLSSDEFQGIDSEYAHTYDMRRVRLQRSFIESERIEFVEGHTVEVSEDIIFAAYNEAREMGHEGIIIRTLDHKYQPKRSYDWMKIKALETEDLEVTEMIEGEGKYEGMLGALVVDRNGVSVDVGTGFSDEERKTFWQMHNEIVGSIIEVQYHEVTPSGSLRHPRYKGIRHDK